MPMTTPAIFIERADHNLSASDYVEWAISMLEQDFDSPSLRILASLDGSSSHEADDYFCRAIRELHISAPNPKENRRAFACDIATWLVAGTLDAKIGVRQLSGICRDFDYAEDYLVWLYLEDALADIEAGLWPHAYDSLTTANFEETVRNEARQFLKTLSETGNHSVPED